MSNIFNEYESYYESLIIYDKKILTNKLWLLMKKKVKK